MSTASIRPLEVAETQLRELTATHAQMLEQLADLRCLVDDLEQRGLSDELRPRAAALLAFFATHARSHHAQEEGHIFPTLLRDGSADTVDLVRRLQQDHGWLEEDWIELAPLLEAVAAGSGSLDPALLRPAVEVFTALYLEHIELEDGQAYPQARALMRLLDHGPERERRQSAAA